MYAIAFAILYTFHGKETVVSMDVMGIIKVYASAKLMFVIVNSLSDLLGLYIFLPSTIHYSGHSIIYGLCKSHGHLQAGKKELVLSFHLILTFWKNSD